MTRVARPVDMSEWLTRTEERVATLERRAQAAPRPATGATSVVFGPNLLPNPGYEGGSIAGWTNPQQGGLVSGSDALAGNYSYRMLHTAVTPSISRVKKSFSSGPWAWRSYTGSGAFKPLTSPQHCWQGQFDGTDGNHRSFLWFDATQWQDAIGTVPGDWEWLDLLIFWEHWFWSEGGTAIVGAHTIDNPPAEGASMPGSGGFPDLTRTTWPGRYLSQSVSLIAIGGVADRIRNGTLRGLMLGPGPTTNNTYYGYARPYDAVIRGTYWKTTSTSIGGLSSEVRSDGVGVTGSNVKWNASVSVNTTVPTAAKLGVWWKNASGTITDVDVATPNLGAGATTPISGTTGAAFSDAAVDLGVYLKMTGSPPSDGSGSTIPWNYTVDDWVLRQQIAG